MKPASRMRGKLLSGKAEVGGKAPGRRARAQAMLSGGVVAVLQGQRAHAA